MRSPPHQGGQDRNGWDVINHGAFGSVEQPPFTFILSILSSDTYWLHPGSKIISSQVEEMARWLKALTALPDSLPSTHMSAHISL